MTLAIIAGIIVTIVFGSREFDCMHLAGLDLLPAMDTPSLYYRPSFSSTGV